MSRAGTSDSSSVQIKPTTNVYTALVAAAIVAELIGFIALFLSYTNVFGSSLFSG